MSENLVENKLERSVQTSHKNQRRKTRLDFSAAKNSKKSKRSFKIHKAKKRNLI